MGCWVKRPSQLPPGQDNSHLHNLPPPSRTCPPAEPQQLAASPSPTPTPPSHDPCPSPPLQPTSASQPFSTSPPSPPPRPHEFSPPPFLPPSPADLRQPAASPLLSSAGIDVSPKGNGLGSVKLSSFPNRKLTPAALRLALIRSLSDASPSEAERFWAELFAACGWGGSGLTPTPDAPRPLVVSVHSGEPVVFTAVPYEAETFDATLCEMIRAKGKEVRNGTKHRARPRLV